jgi:hypothetical protein
VRRLDLNPQKKLRNPQRHLRSLARWPAEIELALPETKQLEGQRYWAFKAPVFSKVVEPPHATEETQRTLFAALFAAAATIEHSALRPAGCRVAVLATTPFMFQSEVTLFPDEDYFGSFTPPKKPGRTEMAGGAWIAAERAEIGEVAHLLPEPPAGFTFHGGTRLTQFDPEWGDEQPVERVNWVWAYDRR